MAEVQRVVRIFERGMEKVIRKMALDITADLIQETPKKTGWAAANWIPSVGQPAPGPVGQRDAVNRGPQSSGIAEVVTQFKLPRPIWISNSVPYVITRLNQGSSSQAPAGYIDAAIDRRVAQANRARIG